MQDVATLGHWNMDALSKNYLLDYNTSALLGSGDWPDAAKNDFGQFHADRMCVTPPPGFVDSVIFPFLPNLRKVSLLLDDGTQSHMFSFQTTAWPFSSLVFNCPLHDRDSS